MESEALIRTCIDICEDRKAENVVAYDVRGKSTLADFYLFCSGNSTTHVRAIASNLDKQLREQGIEPRSIEGTPESQWMLLDYNDVLLHVFLPDTRDNYNVEGLMDASRRCYPEPSTN